jgi:hypothetical protein
MVNMVWVIVILLVLMLRQQGSSAAGLLSTQPNANAPQQLSQGLNSLLAGLSNMLKSSSGGSKGGGGFSGGGGPAGSSLNNPQGSSVDNVENWITANAGPATLQTQADQIAAAQSVPADPTGPNGLIGGLPSDNNNLDLTQLGDLTNPDPTTIVQQTDTSSLPDPNSGEFGDPGAVPFDGGDGGGGGDFTAVDDTAF